MKFYQRIIAEMFGIDEHIEDLKRKNMILTDELNDQSKQTEYYKKAVKDNLLVHQDVVKELKSEIASLEKYKAEAENYRKAVAARKARKAQTDKARRQRIKASKAKNKE